MFWLTVISLLVIPHLFARLIIIIESRDPEKTASWLSLLALFPLFGGVLYFLFGYSLRKRRLFRRKHLPQSPLSAQSEKQKEHLSKHEIYFGEQSEGTKRLARLLLQCGFAPITRQNTIHVLTNGQEKFKALFQDITNAHDHIHLEYYIFRADTVGNELQRLLIRKAREGVKIRLIVDGLGSRALPKDFIRDMREAGIELAWFLPLKLPHLFGSVNYRNHRKLVVIDGKIGYLGGLNVGDEYLSRDPKLGFWRDTHLRIEGESVRTIQATFLNDWYFLTRQTLDHPRYYPDTSVVTDTLTQIIAGGPDSEKDAMKELFFTILTTARQEILLTTPYFIPDESMIMALKSAALSGIQVQILVQGIPDHKLTYFAASSYFEDLLKAGVKIYRYQKGILHSKVLIIDRQISVVGSANFDIRSFQIDFELSALTYGSKMAERLRQDFQHDLQDSISLDYEQYAQRSFWQRIQEAEARLLSPLL